MGGGGFSISSYTSYTASVGKSYNPTTGRVSGQTFHARQINRDLDPRYFKIRECVNSEEHPNTIPVILALDVTGSMGRACKETAEALGVIMADLYKQFSDVEFCMMGIGDLAYDNAPIQMSQFESDIRIAEALDKIYMEHGGGGNSYESYTAAWYMGLYRTKLDCYEKQGRKGIIITMGDEPLNPYLPFRELNDAAGEAAQGDIDTKDLYEEASKKFDIYHIAVDDPASAYRRYAMMIEDSFRPMIGDRLKVSNINNLSNTIVECISDAVGRLDAEPAPEVTGNHTNENGEISW